MNPNVPPHRRRSHLRGVHLSLLAALLAPLTAAATPPKPDGPPPPLDPRFLRADAPKEEPPPPPTARAPLPTKPAQGDGPAAGLVVEAAPDPKGATSTSAAADALTAENMATGQKPKGFLYTMIRGARIDSLDTTILYVRKKKSDKHTKAVPIPKNRDLLAECIAGGGVEDLIKGAQVTVKYDPKGVVRPQIMIESKSEIEVLDGATVLDRGGSKLYVLTADQQRRGFQIEGGAKAWNDVVVGGNAEGLLAGAKVKIEHDPSGRKGLKITILQPAGGAKKKGKGCGCSAHGPRSEPPITGPLWLAALLIGGVLLLRSVTTDQS